MPNSSRRFWQIHLSTALMSMLLAGVLLGVNLVERDVKSEYQKWYADDYVSITAWGWPCRLGEGREYKHGKAMPTMLPHNRNGNAYFAMWDDDPKYAAINLLSCLALTFAFMATCEYIIRRELARRARRLENIAAPATL